MTRRASSDVFSPAAAVPVGGRLGRKFRFRLALENETIDIETL